MSVITSINQALATAGFTPGEVGSVHGPPGEEHITITPDYDDFPVEADNNPLIDAQHADVHFFMLGDYRARIKLAVSAFLAQGLIIEDRRYIEMEEEFKLHHYVISVTKKEVWED